MSHVEPQGGFSLVEVVIAVVITATALVAMLALLGELGGQASGSKDVQTALNLPDSLRHELQILARQRGLDLLAADIPVQSGAADEGLLFVAARDGSRVRLLNSDDARAQYFLLEVRRFPRGVLAYDPGTTILALAVRVSWPYRSGVVAGDDAIIAPASRHTLELNLAVER